MILSSEDKCGLAASTVSVVRFVQLEKALAAIVLRLLGKVTAVIFVQFPNAELPIEVSWVHCVKSKTSTLLQLEKVLLPIVLRFAGMTTVPAISVQPEKAL